jgi:SAM-dependent methyltransferase
MTDLARRVDPASGLDILNLESGEGLPLSTRSFIKALNLNLAPNDEMYEGNDAHYLACGASALNLILCALQLAQVSPREILDFGAGAGRVTRWLRAAFPLSSIGACDLRERDVAFVRNQFQAEAWVADAKIEALKAPTTYDLIWVGSLLTHMSAKDCGRFIDKLLSWTNPRGLLIISSQGRTALLPENQSEGYGLHAAAWRDVQAQYAARGFGYADYPNQTGVGVSLTKLTWWSALVERMPNARMILLSEGLLGDHEDVVAIQNVPIDAALHGQYASASQIASDLVSGVNPQQRARASRSLFGRRTRKNED